MKPRHPITFVRRLIRRRQGKIETPLKYESLLKKYLKKPFSVESLLELDRHLTPIREMSPEAKPEITRLKHEYFARKLLEEKDANFVLRINESWSQKKEKKFIEEEVERISKAKGVSTKEAATMLDKYMESLDEKITREEEFLQHLLSEHRKAGKADEADHLHYFFTEAQTRHWKTRIKFHRGFLKPFLNA